jgi:hypothetical protein
VFLFCLGFLYVFFFYSRGLYVYGCQDWFSIRGSCLSSSLIGDHISGAIFIGYFVGYCLCSCLCLDLVYTASHSFCYFVSLFSVSSFN